MRKLSMAELNRKTVEEFKQAEKNKIIVLLDNIRSAYNVGSIFRTADAFLIEAIFICGYTPPPTHRSVHKTALGAVDTVDWMHFPNIEDAIAQLNENGYRVYAIEQAEQSMKLEKFALPEGGKIAVIFGNEVEGVQNSVLKIADGCIEIPQHGMKHSLNVSVAAGIVLW
ncbi:MAG TPA: RNA methyltransferase, partial [Parafilimonas sp.]|nr:RNA methyltransferase [Parafilimonas sp.]